MMIVSFVLLLTLFSLISVAVAGSCVVNDYAKVDCGYF